jgi:sugar phosphate isomerase/epimerase
MPYKAGCERAPMTSAEAPSRRAFLKRSTFCLGSAVIPARLLKAAVSSPSAFKPKISAHLWVYASAYTAPYDATPDLERAFRDIHLAGYDGIELMEVILRHEDALARLSQLVSKYQLPVTGSSYGAALWDATQHDRILADVTVVIQRLGKLKAETLGISVGDAKRVKTDAELDAQAAILKQIVALCGLSGITANLHNHTYEIENGMHDLKGTLARIPGMKLGPDLNWLVRAGVDPVAFINTYGSQIVYLHIRDQYQDGQWTEYVGEGVTDFPAIAQALRNVHFRGRAAVELAFPAHYVPKYPLTEDWRRSLDYVRKVFGW